MKRFATGLMIASQLGLSSAALARDSEEQRRHTGPVLLAGALTMGYTTLNRPLGSLDGLSLALDCWVGYAPSETTVIHLVFDTVFAPQKLRHYALGLGLVHFFMPRNFYASGSLNLARSCFEPSPSEAICSEFGWGFNLEGGKQFLLDDALGIGPSVQLKYSRLPGGTLVFSLQFGARLIRF